MIANTRFLVDAFGKELGYSSELASSLIKLQIQNLSSMDADWMYSSYHYSHPILTERLKALGWTSEEKVGDKKSSASSSGLSTGESFADAVKMNIGEKADEASGREL